MKKTNKLMAGMVLGALLAVSASGMNIVLPKKIRGTSFGIQAKSVSFESKLAVKDTTVYGLYMHLNKDLGAPLAWGYKLGFEIDYANMDTDNGKSFNYTDYYALFAPTYTIGTGGGNIRFYAGGKFGYNGFENSTGYTYGYIAGAEYNYKMLNVGVDYFSGTTDIEGFDFDISEAGLYLGLNF